jgi:RNA polymerase sigma-70 factor (sigma-E family)
MEWDEEFTAFVRVHSDALYRSAWLLVGQRDAAADLVQETLTGMYRKWDKVRSADLPLAYVRRAIVNKFLSQARARRSTEFTLADLPESSAPDPALSQALDRDLLAAPLAALTPRQRAAVTLRYFDDLPDREAAHILGCPVVTFRSHVRRGLAALRTHLDEPLHEPRASQRLRSI